MVFVVVQIRSLCKVIKPWYGCVVPDQVTLVDLYHQYASGQLDSSTKVSAELVTSHISCSIGCNKRELTRVSPDVQVGDVVSTLGQFVDFNVQESQVSKPLA